MQKLNEIVSNEIGIANEYSFEGNMLGHLVCRVRELEKEMNDLVVFKEKISNGRAYDFVSSL